MRGLVYLVAFLGSLALGVQGFQHSDATPEAALLEVRCGNWLSLDTKTCNVIVSCQACRCTPADKCKACDAAKSFKRCSGTTGTCHPLGNTCPCGESTVYDEEQCEEDADCAGGCSTSGTTGGNCDNEASCVNPGGSGTGCY